MNRKRDPLAPKDITNEQRHSISRHPQLVGLRRERKQLHVEMVARYGSMRKAGGTAIHERHKELSQEIPRLRQQFRRDCLRNQNMTPTGGGGASNQDLLTTVTLARDCARFPNFAKRQQKQCCANPTRSSKLTRYQHLLFDFCITLSKIAVLFNECD